MTIFKQTLRLVVLLPWLIAAPALHAKENLNPIKRSAPETNIGQFVWADLYSADIPSSIDFYSKTFGWKVTKRSENNSSYHLFTKNGQAIAGLIERSADRNKTDKALWIGSVITPNISGKVTKALGLGSNILLPVHDFPLSGKRAVIADPNGGIVALLDSTTKNPINNNEVGNIWVWAQLFSVEPKQAANFYCNVFSYEINKNTVTDNTSAKNTTTYMLSQKGTLRAGVVPLPAALPQRDHWVNFIEVENVDVSVSQALANGGKVIYAPKEVNQVAIIADPNGALLGLLTAEQTDTAEDK